MSEPNYALVIDGTVVETTTRQRDGLIPCAWEVVAGWGYDGETFTPPPVAPRWQTRDFLLRFTPQERMDIRSSTDPVVQDFLDLLRTSDEVVSNHPLTQQGMGHLVAVELLTQERREQILGSSESP